MSDVAHGASRPFSALPGVERYMIAGDIVTILMTSADTGGAFTLHEMRSTYREGVTIPTHVHPHESQVVRVVQGVIGFHIGPQHAVAEVGDTFTMPAGVPHRLWTSQPGESRVLVMTAPGGIEHVIRRLGTPVDAFAQPIVDITAEDIDALCREMLADAASPIPVATA
jgi:quercetin dioxygenase-like cupin family protein